MASCLAEWWRLGQSETNKTNEYRKFKHCFTYFIWISSLSDLNAILLISLDWIYWDLWNLNLNATKESTRVNSIGSALVSRWQQSEQWPRNSFKGIGWMANLGYFYSFGKRIFSITTQRSRLSDQIKFILHWVAAISLQTISKSLRQMHADEPNTIPTRKRHFISHYRYSVS